MITCPYCNETLGMLSPSHLKKHGKTRRDVYIEHPDKHLGSIYIPTSATPDVDGYYADKAVDKLRERNGLYSRWYK